MSDSIKKIVKDFMILLVQKKYEEIEAKTEGKRLSAKEIENVVNDYGRLLTLPPENGYELLEITQINNSEPTKYSVIMPLWSKEEGRSDLSMELTLNELGDGFSAELDDIHVL